MTWKILALLLSAPVLLGAAGDVLPLALDMQTYEAPTREWRSVDDALATPENCRDRIHHVREERSLPKLERETAEPDEPLMIWAVDRREQGCAVMVVKGNPEDIRPLPKGSATVERIPAF